MSDDSIAVQKQQARAEAAARVARVPLESLIHERASEVLGAVASDSRLTEDLALQFLTRRDLPPNVLEGISTNAAVMKSRKVKLALVAHPRTPRHLSLPMARQLFTFELMSLTLMPAVAPDLKVAAEEAIINRLSTIAAGERLTLAKQGSTRVAAALLADTDHRVIEAALVNPHLTEEWVVKAVMRDGAPEALVDAVCRSEHWSVRREVRIALLRNEHTPLARAIVFAQSLPANIVKDVLHHSRLPENIRTYLLAQLKSR